MLELFAKSIVEGKVLCKLIFSGTRSDVILDVSIECVCMDWDHHGRDFMGQFFITKDDLHKVFAGPYEKW